MRLFKIYLFFFVIPFLVAIGVFDGKQESGSAEFFVQFGLLLVGVITQFGFFCFELIQLLSIGSFKEYIGANSWNFQELP